MDIRIDFVQNSAGGNSTYIRVIPALAIGSGTPEIRLGLLLHLTRNKKVQVRT